MKKRKVKCSRLFWVALAVLAVIFLLTMALVLNRPRLQQVSDTSFDLSALDDGIYYGECSNGFVYVKVEVDVQDHTIDGIKIIEHRNGMGEPAEELADQVTTKQSIELDAVTGATYSSQTLLKAIQNALTQ